MAIFSRKSRSRTAPAMPVALDSSSDLEGRVAAIGRDMLARAQAHRAGVLSAKFYSDKLMNWSMKDHDFKVQLFRFVDTFPVLHTPEMIHEHLADYMAQPGVKLPPGLDLGLRAGGVAKGMAAKMISGQIRGMGEKFIAGTDAADALPSLRRLWDDNIAFSVDLLGEACVSAAEADMYQAKYLDLVTNLKGEADSWASKDLLERDHLGRIPRVNVSVKVSSLSPVFDPIDSEGAIRDLMTRLEPVLEAARDAGVLVNFDMEQHELKDLTLEAFFRACERIDFQAGLAMQAYLKSGPEDARRVSEWAQRTGRIVTVRLVKGAYWDFETIHAEQEGWPCPVWNEKWQTDKCFEEMTEIFVGACPNGEPAPASELGPTRRSPGQGGVKLALGSHNVRSVAYALAQLEERDLPAESIELQMLHGMADQLKYAAADMGLRVREYVPVGEMIPGMAYLVRRLLENTSNESWLKAGFLDNLSPEELLAPPGPGHNGNPDGKPDLYTLAPERHELSPAHQSVSDGRPFFNEPLRDFAEGDQRERFAAAIAASSIPRVDNDQTPDQAHAMVARAAAVFPQWRASDPQTRAEAMVLAANAMRARRDELAGVMIREAGKTWREADADVCEAIDFCEYYARLAIELFRRERLGRFIGELDEHWYQPRGVCAVISPWNFPLAICCGMTSAALVTGNTVVVKPAEQTPGIAKIMVEVLWEAIDTALKRAGSTIDARHVLHFCPAPGETTGAALVRDPRIALIAFTGSKAVGLDIVRAAGETGPDQTHVKKVVCEMGGKNALIIDSSADLDEAVLGTRHSAFGFQGQKCSACSRCIVVDPEGPDGRHISLFTKRLVESTRALVLGDPLHPGTDVGPVIDLEAAHNIRRFIETAKSEGCTAELELPLPPEGLISDDIRERMVSPTIFRGVRADHTIARDEIFGPVLAIMHASTFDEALELANGHTYKLTGGIFTRKPTHIERVKQEFRVGNLYINRGITGALVGRQPFGGFGMSGVGSKAGGADYLLQFVEPRASCENTMRRGFAPEL